jgi:hypothetical protein
MRNPDDLSPQERAHITELERISTNELKSWNETSGYSFSGLYHHLRFRRFSGALRTREIKPICYGIIKFLKRIDKEYVFFEPQNVKKQYDKNNLRD